MRVVSYQASRGNVVPGVSRERTGDREDQDFSELSGGFMNSVGSRVAKAGLALLFFAGGWIASNAYEPAIAGTVLPVKLDRDDLAGKAFQRFQSLVQDHEEQGQVWSTTDAEIFLSPDKQFDAGVYRSGPVRLSITEDYGVHEFMYFLEGSVLLTSADGSRLEVSAGEAVLIPGNWRGIWDSPAGYRKIYVIYSPSGPIVP